jgi:biopolymer transport protein ExbD
MSSPLVKFRALRQDRPELNLIPMIDVLIVLLIFLVLTTTFSRESALKIHLPESSSHAVASEKGIEVSIDDQGRLFVDQKETEAGAIEPLKKALTEVSGGQRNAMIIIRADRNTPHQAVMTVLDAASQLGFTRVAFATQVTSAAP